MTPEINISKILMRESKIQAKVQKLADALTRDYKNSRPLVVVLLKGAAIFAADMVRALPIEVDVAYLNVSSYEQSTTTGDVVIEDVWPVLAKDRDVIVLDEIIDTGLTLDKVTKYLAQRGAASVKTVALVDKYERRKVPFEADYVGQKVPDKFLVGYGMDYNGDYRNLPYIAVLGQ